MKQETADKMREIIRLRAEIDKLKQNLLSIERYNEWLRDQLQCAETALRKKDYIIAGLEKEHDFNARKLSEVSGASTSE